MLEGAADFFPALTLRFPSKHDDLMGMRFVYVFCCGQKRAGNQIQQASEGVWILLAPREQMLFAYTCTLCRQRCENIMAKVYVKEVIDFYIKSASSSGVFF